MIPDSGLEIRWSEAAGGSDVKDHCPVLVEGNPLTSGVTFASSKQSDKGPKPPDLTLLFSQVVANKYEQK